MPALTTFCNPDPQALRIAQQLHRSENPTLTVLFGSRARGDYAPGRSDVDILMVQDQSPTDEQDQRVKLQAQSLSASLYRGYWVPVQVMWMPLEEFEKSRRRVNGVAARAIDHGIVLSNSSTDYGTWSRRAQTSYLIGRAKRHLNLFLDRQLKSESTDHQVGVQAFDAIRDALKAVVYAQGEWCPDLEDVDMLIDLAARADPGFDFRPAIAGDVYSQYRLARLDLPTELPLSSVMNRREMVEKDLRTLLDRVDGVRESWKRNSPATTSHGKNN